MISTLDHFLDPTDLEYYSEYVRARNTTQKVINDPETAFTFWKRYQSVITAIVPDAVAIYPSVTVTQTRTPIQRHTDTNHHGERYKLLVYLNDIVNGGTIFYPPGLPAVTIQNQANRMVIFDMDIPHESQDFTSSTKYPQKKMAIGFRLATKI
jgi:hypothetical protein